jgi:hypothetical protein
MTDRRTGISSMIQYADCHLLTINVLHCVMRGKPLFLCQYTEVRHKDDGQTYVVTGSGCAEVPGPGC